MKMHVHRIAREATTEFRNKFVQGRVDLFVNTLDYMFSTMIYGRLLEILRQVHDYLDDDTFLPTTYLHAMYGYFE